MTDPEVIPDLLEIGASRWPDLPIQREVATGRVWTYGHLRARVEGLAGRLGSLGIAPGIRVALVGDNGPEWTAAYLAVVRLGATVVPLDPTEDARRLEDKARAARAAGVLLGRRLARPGEAGTQGLPAVRVAGFALDLLDERTFEAGPVPGCERRPEPGSVASLLFTSGTTGAPRAVPLTHSNLLAEYRGLSRIAPPAAGDRTLALVPFHHVLGFNVGFMLALGHGVEVGFLPALTREALSEALSRMAPGAVCGVPAIWIAMRQGIETAVRARGRASPRVFSLLRRLGRGLGPGLACLVFHSIHRSLGGSLRLVITSGAPFAPTEVAFWKDLGCEVLHAYGLTESSGAVTCSRPGDPKDAGVGRPLDGVEIRIAAPGPDGAGEILARGPVVMAAYEGGGGEGAEDGATAIVDGWLHTGDLGRIDDRGFLHVLGRRREVIVTRAGETVYPDEVEERLEEAGYVREVAVVPEGPAGDERPVAVVVPDREAMARDGVLDVFGAVRYSLLARAAGLPAGWRPVEYRIFPGPLPRTATRKIRRIEVRDLLRSGHRGWGAETMVDRRRAGGRAVDLGTGAEARAVAESLAEVLRPGAPEPDIRHALGADLGLDSIDRVSLVVALESRLGHALPESAVRADTVARLIEIAGGTSDLGFVDWLDRLAPGALDRDPPDLRRAERTARAMRPLRELLSGLFRVVGRVVFDVRVQGLDRLPESGPFLICSNHQSYLDPYFLLPNLPRAVRERLWVLAVDWLFRGPVSRLYLHTARTLPVDNRGGGFLDGLRTATRVLQRGDAALIFPEGMRSFDGRVGPWRPGAGLLALRTGVPLVPAAIAGVYDILPPGRLAPSLRDERGGRRRVRIAFGEPVAVRSPDPGEDVAGAAQRIVDGLRQRSMELLRGFAADGADGTERGNGS